MSDAPPQLSSTVWTGRTKRNIALLVTLVIFVFLWFVRESLPIVIVAVVVAYLLHPVVSILEKWVFRLLPVPDNTRRLLAILVTFVLVIIFFIVLLLIIIPLLLTQLEEFGRSLPRIMENVESQLETVLSQPIMFQGEPILINGEPFIPIEQIAEAAGTGDLGVLLDLDNIDVVGAVQSFVGSVGNLTGPAFSVLGNALTTIFNITFLVVMIFYLLKDGSSFNRSLVDFAPEQYRGDVARLLYELRMVWDAYLRGQILLCFVMGMLVYLSASLLGVPNAPILGLLAGVLEFVPNLGPLLALIPAAFLALVSEGSTTIPGLEGFWFMVAVIVVWTTLQNLESLFLVPRIMGDSLNLHPFVVIIAVIFGANLAGPLGIILAAPFVASGRVIGEYIYGKLLDEEPFKHLRSDNDTSSQFELLPWILNIINRLRSGQKVKQAPDSEPADD